MEWSGENRREERRGEVRGGEESDVFDVSEGAIRQRRDSQCGNTRPKILLVVKEIRAMEGTGREREREEIKSWPE